MPVLCAVILIFSFQFSLTLLVFNRPTQYRTSDVAENLGRSLYGTYYPGERFELILTVKMETRHPVEGHLEVNFGRSVIIAEL